MAVHLAVAGGVYDGVFLCCLFFQWDVLGEILVLTESVSEGFPTYSCNGQVSLEYAVALWDALENFGEMSTDDGHKVYVSGEDGHENGVGFLVPKNMVSAVIRFRSVSSRRITIRSLQYYYYTC